jgi:predicted dehydrogenase
VSSGVTKSRCRDVNNKNKKKEKPTMNKHGIGIIGCGGRVRSLAALLKEQHPEVEFVAFSDPRPESVTDTRKALGAENATEYADYHELLKDERVAWVMIGSWNCFHREQAVAALNAGKHVFCEKPLATTVEDCLAIRDAGRNNPHLKFIVGFTLRYSPHYRKIKKLLDEGVVGDIISMEFNETLHFCHGGYIMGDWRRLTKNAGTHLLEKCCHDIDLVNWMLEDHASRVASFAGLNVFTPENAGLVDHVGPDENGKPAYQTWPGTVNLNPFTADKDILDNQVAIIEYSKGVRATFHTNCSSAIPERRMYICGTEGAIRADVISGTIEYQRIGFEEGLQTADTGAAGGHGGGDHVLTESIYDCMVNDAEPLTGIADGIASAFTIFAIDEAERSGQVVSVEPYWSKAG